MKRIVNSYLKPLIWKLTRRDFIILNPKAHSLFNLNNFSLIAERSEGANGYLPVKYNYHINKNWHINYEIRGNGEGKLTYFLSVPNEDAFCKLETNITLPYRLEIQRINNDIFANGQKLNPISNKELPLKTFWLVGKFNFQSSDGKSFSRQTGHRLRLNTIDESASEEYFKGDVYANYEDDARFVPDQILNKIEQYVPNKGKFLDVGCATGMTVKYALEKGFDAEGIDFSEWAVEQANLRTNNRCRVLNFDTASSSDFTCKYDAISLHSVIEHLSEPEEALKKLFDICNPNGVVYIETLNADSMMHKIMGKDWAGYSDYTHKSPWITADWLVETAKEKGFEVLSAKRYFLWNDNVYDDAWRALNFVFMIPSLNALLEDGLGDLIELVIRRPSDS